MFSRIVAARRFWLVVVVALPAVAGLLAGATTQAQPSGLVAAYSFNEGSGSGVADASGTGNTGTISGASWVAQGKFGSALSFDGVNDWVTVNDAASLDLTTGMTLEAWVFPTALSAWRTVMLKERPGHLDYATYANTDTGRPGGEIFTTTSSDTRGPAALLLNAWTHLAVTYDGAALRLYVNGPQVASRAVSGSVVTSTGPLRIGGNSIWGEYFQGRIDEVRIYNRALSQAEIQTDMNTAVAGDTAAPIISSVASSGVTVNSATITWTTNEPADSQVDYGLTTGYGSSSVLNTALVTSHSVGLSGLSAGTLYHYRVRSEDAAQNLALSSDNSFTTAAPDTTPPGVAITSPQNDATVSATVSVTADASDNVGVKGVQFLLDGVDLGTEDTAAPYAASWNTTTVANGAHVLSARARDAAGNSTLSASVPVTVSNPPRLVITAPANDASISGTIVDVSYTTSGDLTGVDHVHFKLDTSPEVMDLTFGGVYQFSNVPAGPHTLNGYLARSDHSKITGSDASPVSFTTSVPDTSAPSVAITNPGPGASVSGTVAVTADASDNLGVAGVQFLLDGANLGAEDMAAPYTVSWNTSTAAQGSHSLTARARDAAENTTTSAPVIISVLSPTDPAVIGQWSPRLDWPLVAVHATLLPAGDVLVWDGWEPQAAARVWKASTQTFLDVPNPSGLFCSAHSFLADGRLLVTGGHAGGEIGIKDVNIFDPATSSWTRAPDMKYARWYPSSVTLGDGRVVTISGQITSAVFADTPEIYDPTTEVLSTLAVSTSSVRDREYPFPYLLPNGKIYVIGATPGAVATLDVAAPSWTHHGSISVKRGSAVMYRPGQILYTGGGNGSATDSAQASASAIDGNQTPPQWRSLSPMKFGRYQHNLVVLPDGKVFAVGGSTIMSLTSGPGVLEPEIWDPDAGTWTTMAPMRDPRMYHSTALLLPDGRVLVAGGGRLSPAVDYFSAEIYAPPYLFKGTRPSIVSAPATFGYGAAITIQTPDASDISSVALLRLGSTTHTMDMNQNYIPVSFTRGAGALTVQAPGNRNIAPPGHYMLVIVNSREVPSVGSIVRFPAPSEDTEPPTAPTDLTAIGSTGAANLSWTVATDDTAVAHYNVHRSTTAGFTPTSSNRVAQPLATTYSDAGLAAGTYYYRVTAQDGAGNVSASSNEASADVAADLTPPDVTMTSPANGATVSGLTTVSAQAADNVLVAGVQFMLDGALLGAEDTTAPYSISWNTPAVTNAVYTLRAQARDGAGNKTLSMPVSVTVSNSAIAAGLVAAFGFNEGSGATAIDASGSGNGGTVSGAIWSTSGKFGGALSFDGVNDWVTVADANSLDLGAAMTLEAWVNPAALSGWRMAILKEIPGGLAYALYAHDNAPRPAVTVNVGGGDVSSVGASALPLNAWTHLAATYDGATLRLFVNGTQAGSRALTGNLIVSSSALRIGGNAVWGEYFQGRIDEVRIYNRGLSQAEIQADMVTPIP